MIVHGDCIEAMREMPEASVDAVVCDPPYGLEFMGKEWDRLQRFDARDKATKSASMNRENAPVGTSPTYVAGPRMQEWHEAWATEALRVLKPGGHMLAAGSSRTFHRLVCAIEDAGFEVRDTITHHYGSGFPKSASVSKAIDKAAGAEREVVGPDPNYRARVHSEAVYDGGQKRPEFLTAPATPEAEQWQGWGTALKPSTEFWCVARKPLVGNVARNVLEFGTGAINVDATRVGASGGTRKGEPPKDPSVSAYGNGLNGNAGVIPTGEGRWPPNAVFSHAAGCQQVGTRRVKGAGFERNRPDRGTGAVYGEHRPSEFTPRCDPDGTEEVESWTCAEDCPVAELDRQSSNLHRAGNRGGTARRGMGYHGSEITAKMPADYGDSGGASRFFYVAKASRAEREAGLIGSVPCGVCGGIESATHMTDDGREAACVRCTHPTVKPLGLMRWLVRLVTPPGGTVLDPFAGSGSTGLSCALEGFTFVGIEREAEYVEIARARIAHWQRVKDSEPLTLGMDTAVA